jgi:glycerophosphoryl diester phosphodiesterase
MTRTPALAPARRRDHVDGAMRGPKPFVTAHAPRALVAHRGGAGLAPENTVAAFQAAASRWRCDQLELDLRLSRDGVAVVMHDATVDRTTDGTGAVASLRLADLKALDAGHRFTPDGGRSHPFRGRGVRVPTFEEALRATDLPIIADLKDDDEGLRHAVRQAIARAGAWRRVCVGSMDDGAAEALRAALDPEVALFFPARAARAFVEAVAAGRAPPPPLYDLLALPARWAGHAVASPPLVRAARAAGLRLQLWTVDEATEMRALLALGVDGVQTDRPDRLRAVLDGG